MSADLPDHAGCRDALARAGLTLSPSEAHGIAVGLLAGDVADPERHWAETLYADLEPDDVLAQEARALLDQVFAAAREQLQDASFGLQLWLPPEAPAGQESEAPAALRDWAQGFLYGFGLAGEAAARERLSAEGQEALRDFYEIGNMAEVEGTLGEEEQQALSDLEEYMRVAAMLIHEDMHRREPTGEESHEIH